MYYCDDCVANWPQQENRIVRQCELCNVDKPVNNSDDWLPEEVNAMLNDRKKKTEKSTKLCQRCKTMPTEHMLDTNWYAASVCLKCFQEWGVFYHTDKGYQNWLIKELLLRSQIEYYQQKDPLGYEEQLTSLFKQWMEVRSTLFNIIISWVGGDEGDN